MKLSRRNFVAVAGGVSAAAIAGCGKSGGEIRNDLRRLIGKPTASPLNGSLTAPAAGEIDEISHIINRLTFGPRAGDYARVAQLGVSDFIEEQLAPEKIEDRLCQRVIRHECFSLEEP